MELTTERLRIVPLSPHLLKLWTEDLAAFECTTGCRYRDEPMQDVFRQIVREQCRRAADNPANEPFYTFWMLVTDDRTIIGSACFKGPPDAEGNVEIGYCLGAEFRRCGYMSEAVWAMCVWVIRQPDVRYITAETDPDGVASQRLLQRLGLGFERCLRDDACWWNL